MRVAIAGAGKVGRSIARELIGNGHDVLLIDRDHDLARPDVVARLGPVSPPPTSAPEGFLMALTEAEQREILAKVRSTDIRVQELDQQLTDGADAKKGGISRRILDSLARLEARKP